MAFTTLKRTCEADDRAREAQARDAFDFDDLSFVGPTSGAYWQAPLGQLGVRQFQRLRQRTPTSHDYSGILFPQPQTCSLQKALGRALHRFSHLLLYLFGFSIQKRSIGS